MIPILFGLQGSPVPLDDLWVPVTAALTVVICVMGGTWTVGRYMASQEKQNDDRFKNLTAEIERLRTEMLHRFERLEDRHSSTVSHKEWYKWVDRLRRANDGKVAVPAPFEEE